MHKTTTQRKPLNASARQLAELRLVHLLTRASAKQIAAAYGVDVEVARRAIEGR